MNRNRNQYGRRHSNIDWEAIGAWIVGILLFGGVVTGGVALANEDWCTGVEPDGETEQMICPDGWHDGETRNIREDEFEGEED